MNEATRSWVELLALQLAGLVVATHVYWGLDRFAEQLRYGVYVDPRPLLFVLSSAAIIAGAAYVALGGRRKPVYALGILLMLVYIFGYWGWHLMGHLPALPWVDSQGHPHPGWGPVETLFRHLETDDLALVSKLAELALAIVLGMLWVDLHRSGTGAPEGSDVDDSGGSAESPPATDSAPDPAADASPEPTTDATPKPPTDATPEPTTDATREPPTDAEDDQP